MPVANPLDAMCQAVYRLSGFPRERVIGMAGVLDSARMRTFIAQALDVSVENVHAFVLGGHGDTMVPLPRYSTVAGIAHHRAAAGRPDCGDRQADSRRRRGDHEAGRHERLVHAGLAAAEMVEVILKDKKKILPCSVFLQGEYGISDLFVGVPVKLGARGVEQIIQITLTAGRDRGPAQVGSRGEGTHGLDQGLIRCCVGCSLQAADSGPAAGRGLRPAPPAACSLQPAA